MKYLFKAVINGLDWQDRPISLKVDLTAPNSAIAFHEAMHQWQYSTNPPPRSITLYSMGEVKTRIDSDRVIDTELIEQEKTDAETT